MTAAGVTAGRLTPANAAFSGAVQAIQSGASTDDSNYPFSNHTEMCYTPKL
jgi:hypothetical protein